MKNKMAYFIIAGILILILAGIGFQSLSNAENDRNDGMKQDEMMEEMNDMNKDNEMMEEMDDMNQNEMMDDMSSENN